MPEIISESNKTSSFSGLFVFLDLSIFTIYCCLLCFTHGKTWGQALYSLRNSLVLPKKPTACVNFEISVSYLRFFQWRWADFCSQLQKHLKYKLQKIQFLIKRPEYYLKAYSIGLNLQKSFQKQSKAPKIWYSSLPCPICLELIRSFFNQKSVL